MREALESEGRGGGRSSEVVGKLENDRRRIERWMGEKLKIEDIGDESEEEIDEKWLQEAVEQDRAKFEATVSKEELEQMEFLDGGNGEYLSNHMLCDGNREVATPLSQAQSSSNVDDKTGRNHQPRQHTREIDPAPYRRVERKDDTTVHDDSTPRVTQIDVHQHKPSVSVESKSASVATSASAVVSASTHQKSASVATSASAVVSASAHQKSASVATSASAVVSASTHQKSASVATSASAVVNASAYPSASFGSKLASVGKEKQKNRKKRRSRRKKSRKRQRMERGPKVETCESNDESSDEKSEIEDAGCLSHTSPPPILPCSNQIMQNSKRITGTACIGLEQPQMDSGKPVTGKNKVQHRKENKFKRRIKQVAQSLAVGATAGYHGVSYWAKHEGLYNVPTPKTATTSYVGQMCPSNAALDHPARNILLQYAQEGCPVETGEPWTREMIEAAVMRGPHVSAMVPEAMNQLQLEVAEKEKNDQVRVVNWDDIKDNLPKELKVSPIAMIPHKSRMFRAILDLSFGIRLEDGAQVPSVNESSIKTAPRGAIDQLGQSLDRVIHAMAQAEQDAKVFMAKWDIKDGFWRLVGRKGEEWNFAYVLPQEEGKPIKLVIPTSLQMGWIESPPYFCAASETGRDVAQQYAEAPVGSLENHKFIAHSLQGEDYETFQGQGLQDLRYSIEVYVDDYISLAMPRTKEDLRHVANAVMKGVHDVFPADQVAENDPLSYKKMLKLESMWALTKEILGFTFDGDNKTIWLAEDKREKLLATLHQWLRQATREKGGIKFDEFQSTIAKLRHAFISIPSGKGLLSPCNAVLRKQPKYV